MHQGWKKLPLLVIFLLFWKNADGFKGGAYSDAHHWWGQPSDALSPDAQSSMSEARVTGTLPVEEVGSGLFPNKPLKSKSKFNVLQFVKGGSSSYQSTSHAQTAPGSSVSASLPLPPVQQPSSSLTSSGSTISSVAKNSQSTSVQSSPSLHVVSPQSSFDSKSTDPAASSYTQGSVSYSSLSSQAQGSATSQGSSGAELSASSVPTQEGSNRYGVVSQSLTASSPYTPGSLMSNKLDALPLGVPSHSTSVQSSPSVSTSSSQSRSGTQLATSSGYVPVQGGSSSTRFSLKPQGTLGQYAPASPTKYVSAPMSSPQAIYSQTTSSGSPYRTVSQVGSLSQTGASGQFTSQGGNHYSGLLPQSQATSSQYDLDYSKLISSPQKTSSQSASVLSSRKQYASASLGSSGAKLGASTGFASQGMSSSYSGSVQSQGTTGQFATGSPPPYDGLYCKCALSPQGVDSQSIQSSSRQFTSSYGTQPGSSTFTLKGSIAYDGSPQPQGTASQFAPVSHSYPSVSPSQDVASRSTTVQGYRKQLTSTYMGSSDQGGSSAPFILQGSTAYGGSPQAQDATSQFAPGSPSSYPGLSLSSPQGVASQSSLQKQFTSASQSSSGAQFGASTGFASQGMSRFPSGSVQSLGTTSQFAPGPQSPYASVPLFSPQAGPSTVQGYRKQLTSTFTGSSGTQAGSSTPFALQGSTTYGGSPQPQYTAGTFAPGSRSSYANVPLSSPQARPSTTVQGSRKQLTSTFTGSSGTQAGSSTRFTLLGSTAYGGSSQPQDAASPFIPGSSSPYASVSLSSQGVASQSSQSYQGYSVPQSQKSQRRQPLATHWTQDFRTSDAVASQGSSSQSSPMQFSSLSSARGSSRVSDRFVSAWGGSTSYDGSLKSQSLSTRYTPGSQLLPYAPSVAGQGTSSDLASEVLSSYSSMNSQNAPAPSRSSSSSRFYSVKG